MELELAHQEIARLTFEIETLKQQAASEALTGQAVLLSYTIGNALCEAKSDANSSTIM